MLALLCSFFHHEYSPLHSTPPSILALSSPPLFPFFLHSLYIDAYNHLDSLFFFIFASRLSPFRLYKRKYKKLGAFYSSLASLCFIFYHAISSPQNSHRRRATFILARVYASFQSLSFQISSLNLFPPIFHRATPLSLRENFSQFSFSTEHAPDDFRYVSLRTKAFLSKKINS